VTGHELVARGETLEEALAAAAAEVGRLVAPGDTGEPDRVPMLVESPDLDTLVPDFVDDLLYLAEFERFAADRVERLELEGSHLRAAVSGRTGATRRLDCAGVRIARPDGLWELRVLVSER
jgi:SHS2 domain-containing protein